MATLREEQMKQMQERLHPRSTEQFSRLFNELDEWRRTETLRIKQLYPPGDERTQEMNKLLAQETKALQDIQRLKSIAAREHSSQRTRSLLEFMARPQQWQMSSGLSASVETPQTLRAAELLALHDALGEAVVSVPSRHALLDRVLNVVCAHQSPLIGDIEDLVYREKDLLDRNRPLRSMEMLRLRLGTLFLQFIQDPRYNQRASEYVRYGS